MATPHFSLRRSRSGFGISLPLGGRPACSHRLCWPINLHDSVAMSILQTQDTPTITPTGPLQPSLSLSQCCDEHRALHAPQLAQLALFHVAAHIHYRHARLTQAELPPAWRQKGGASSRYVQSQVCRPAPAVSSCRHANRLVPAACLCRRSMRTSTVAMSRGRPRACASS